MMHGHMNVKLVRYDTIFSSKSQDVLMNYLTIVFFVVCFICVLFIVVCYLFVLCDDMDHLTVDSAPY
jgi:ABC-type uncharacterized transport system permease subunit